MGGTATATATHFAHPVARGMRCLWRVRLLATTPCYSSVLRSRGDRHALDRAWRRWPMARASCEGHLQRRFSSHPTPSPFPPPPPPSPPPPLLLLPLLLSGEIGALSYCS